MNNPINAIVLSIIGFVSGVFIGMHIGNSCGERSMKKQMQEEAIKHNSAYYDSKTGKFLWNVEVVK